MHKLKSLKYLENRNESLQPIMIGFLCFVAAFLLRGTFQGNDLRAKLGWFVVVGFGIFMMVAGIALWLEFRQFQTLEAWVDREPISRGEVFRFIFEGTTRQPVTIESFTTSLLFRETVQFQKTKGPKNIGTKTFDRVVHTAESQGCGLTKGATFCEEFKLHIPVESMGIQNPFMGLLKAQVRGAWVVKVDLSLKKGILSREYELPLAGSVFAAPDFASETPTP